MYLRLEKQAVTEAVKIIRRLFVYNANNGWINKDLEVIQVASGSKLGVYEKFHEDNEKYPTVTIGSSGGRYINTAINDLVKVYDSETVPVGSRSLQMLLVNNTAPVASEIPSTAYGQTVRGLFTEIAFAGIDYGDDPLEVQLYQNYLSAPVLLASGSYDIDHMDLRKDYTYLYPAVALSNTAGANYWLLYQIPTGSSYYLSIDNTINRIKVGASGSVSTGSVVADVLLPSFVRVGGMFQGNMTITVEAKNDSDGARNIIEIIAVFFNLLKQAEVYRNRALTMNTRSVFITSELVDEWIEKGIRLGAMSAGELQMRRRTDNDQIFSIALRVEYYTDWFEDYP